MVLLVTLALAVTQIFNFLPSMTWGVNWRIGRMGGMEGMDEECCPMKKIWGSMDPKMDGVYKNVGTLPRESLPPRCNSPCVYERKGWEDGLQFCFGDSMYSQSQCQAMEEGEEPVDMGSGGEKPVDMGSGSGDNPDMGGSGSRSSM